MDLALHLLLALRAPAQLYSETPTTDPAVAVRWNGVWSSGICLAHNQILAVTDAKDPGPGGAALEVYFSAKVCSGGDYCSISPAMHVGGTILRKEPGPIGTLLLLLSVSQLPGARLTPYHFGPNAKVDDVHVRLFGIFEYDRKLCPQDESGLRGLAIGQKIGCTQVVGVPVLQGPHLNQLGGETVVGSVAACDPAGNLRVLPADKLQPMLDSLP